MAKQTTLQPTKASVASGAVPGSQSDGYLNPNAVQIGQAVGRHAGGSPTAAKYAASGKGVFDKQLKK